MRLGHRWSIALGAGLVGVAVVLVSCGDDNSNTAGGAGSAKAATQVKVTLKESSIVPAPSTVSAGEVHFVVNNTGKEVHELIVVKSDADPAKLPIYGASDKPPEDHLVGDVNEDKVTSMGEVDDIAPGATKDMTIVLQPGKYILMCNIRTHYTLGMHIAFTVKP